MTLLTKFRDDTFIWTVSQGVFGPMKYAEMIAIGRWNFNIKKNVSEVVVNYFRQVYFFLSHRFIS